jgi:Yip1 domain
MVEPEVQSANETTAGLTQWQRVANAFVSPSKTFEDIRRGNRSWWLPLIVLALASYFLFAAVGQKIGFQQVVDNQIRISPNGQDRISQMTPEQRASYNSLWLGITKVLFLAGPLIGLIIMAILTLVLLGTINFVFGGRARYGSLFSVYYYAYLPSVVKVLLGVAVIYAGMAPESFNVKNFAPTNVAAFLDPVDTNKALYALASAADVVTIWILVLLSIGVATVAGVKRSAGYIAVFGWWLIVVLVQVGAAAAFGS